MKINQSTNLRVEDYVDQSAWIGRLFTVLNAYFANIDQIFDQNVDYATNIKSVKREFDLSQFTYPIKFAWPFPQAAPTNLQVTKATVGVEATALLAAWEYNASTSEISVTALTEFVGATVRVPVANSRYRFTIRATI
jgi:hypothetical protein